MAFRERFLILVLLLLLSPQTVESKPAFEVTGTRIIPQTEVVQWLTEASLPLRASGPVLSRYVSDFLETELQDRGFTHARVWSRFEGNVVRIQVDEGRIPPGWSRPEWVQ